MNLRIFISLLASICSITASGQNTINNLSHQPGYVTGSWGKPGQVDESGSGNRSMILLPGWGFDGEIFKSFVAAHQGDYKIYTVTFPGFGNTPAPPMPDQPESYKDLHWTKGIIKGLTELIDSKKLDHPILVTCFTYSDLIAFRLALDFPEKIGKVVIISGMAKYTANYPSLEPRNLAQRVDYVEKRLAQQWFKTVTRETWDKGNFAPSTFTLDSVKALAYWKQMSAVPIPTMVRYLCEYYCTDVSLEYANLKVPVLVVLPSFDSKVLAANPYLAPFFHFSWSGALPASKMLHLVTITGTSAFIMDDQPAKLTALIKEFVAGDQKAFIPIR